MFLTKRKWPRFSEPQLCRNHIYTIAIVKFSNSSIQDLFNFDKGTCMDSLKLKKNGIKIYPLDIGVGFLLLKEDDIIRKIEEQLGKAKIIDCDPAQRLINEIIKILC